MKRFNKSKSSLLLMEIIITIGLFMICGAICIKFFVNAYLMDKKSTELDNAVVLASSSMEVMLSKGNEENNLKIYYPHGESQNEKYFIYFNEDNQECEKDSAYYIVTNSFTEDGNIKNLKSTVSAGSDGHVIYELESAKAVD